MFAFCPVGLLSKCVEASCFTQLLAQLNLRQLERINVYFNEATGGRYVPRAVLLGFLPTADWQVTTCGMSCFAVLLLFVLEPNEKHLFWQTNCCFMMFYVN